MTSPENPTDPESVVSAFVDGHATPEQDAWVRAASASDPDVAALLDETRALKVLLSGLPAPVATDDDWDRIRTGVLESSLRERRGARLQRVLGIAAAVMAICAVALGAVLMVQGTTSPDVSNVALESTTVPQPRSAPTTRPAPAGSSTAGSASLPVALGDLIQPKNPRSTTTSTTSTTRPATTRGPVTSFGPLGR